MLLCNILAGNCNKFDPLLGYYLYNKRTTMKTLLILAALAALPLLLVPAHAQTKEGSSQTKDKTPVWRNDPMYSTHNYKHPNKAATAQRCNPAAGVAVNKTASGNQMANYKMPATQRVPTGGITVPHSPDLGVANRNYKMPRPHAATIEVKTGVPTRPASTSATGD